LPSVKHKSDSFRRHSDKSAIAVVAA
jgi:hypothetical protein